MGHVGEELAVLVEEEALGSLVDEMEHRQPTGERDRLASAIHALLESGHWTEGEKWVVKWQYQRSLALLSGFQVALADAITRADDSNLARLRLGFPAEVDGFLAWNRGDLAKRLRDAGVIE